MFKLFRRYANIKGLKTAALDRRCLTGVVRDLEMFAMKIFFHVIRCIWLCCPMRNNGRGACGINWWSAIIENLQKWSMSLESESLV